MFKELPVDLKSKALELIPKFQAELDSLLGCSQRKFHSIDVRQSETGPSLAMDNNDAIIVVGPNATAYEPTLVSNVAHECVHLHLYDGGAAYSSGLEEGCATHFELSVIESQFGLAERDYFEQDLPNTYLNALRDYEVLINVRTDAAKHMRNLFGSLSGLCKWKIRSEFPTIGRLRCYRLARRRRMR